MRFISSRDVPESNQSDEVGNTGAGVPEGIVVPTVAALQRTRPWRASVRRSGSPARSAGLPYVDNIVGFFMVDNTISP
jgi:hypothetical protein